jgi:multicomponent Na+:H+ antiporter subunit C
MQVLLFAIEHMNYWAAVILLMIGLYIVITRGNLIKKVVGLNIFQSGVFLLYISMGYVIGAGAPIAAADIETYSNPLPHVLILTAIVVAVATSSLALALIVRIKEDYGTIEEDDIIELDKA